MNSVHKPIGNLSDFTSGKYSDKNFIFELVKENTDKSLMKKKETGEPVRYPLTHKVPMTGTIFFTNKTGETYPRRIRFCDGETSIYVDEQQPDDKYPKRTVVAEFVKGKFPVDGQNSTMLKFMMSWDMNETKINRDKKKSPIFRLIDNSKKAEKAQEAEDLLFDVIDWCRNADWETKVQPFCSMIFPAETMMQSVKEIRYNLVQVAKQDLSSFKKYLDDPKTERTLVVRAAIEKGLIVVDSSLNSLFWSDNANVPLNSAGPGKDPIEDFIVKSFSGKGEEIYKAIDKLVNPTEEYIAETKQEARIIEAPILKGCEDSDEELLKLVRAGVDKEVIKVSNKLWWKYKDDSSKGEAGIVAKLKDNPIMLKLLKSDVLGE